MNVKEVLPSRCTGCFACASACPVHCIEKGKDSEGFLIPVVDEQICIDCGKCAKACPTLNKQALMHPSKVFAARRTNGEKLRNCASGGIASLLSEFVLRNNGVVYGCGLFEGKYIRHTRCATEDELDRLSRSKYVQSDCFGIFDSVKKDCDAGCLVLFVGTPCQIAGLKTFLMRDYHNLFTVDLICHGVPNNDLFVGYLDYLKKKHNDISSYRFRDSSKKPWVSGANVSYKTKAKTRYVSQHIDPFGSSFFWAENYRHSCYNCDYSCPERIGDITIGDYWCCLDFHPDFNIDELGGISAVLINSERGSTLFESVRDELVVVDSKLEYVAKHNPNLLHHTDKPSIRDKYYLNFKSKGFGWVSKRRFFKKDYYYHVLKLIVPDAVKKKLKRRKI